MLGFAIMFIVLALIGPEQLTLLAVVLGIVGVGVIALYLVVLLTGAMLFQDIIAQPPTALPPPPILNYEQLYRKQIEIDTQVELTPTGETK